MWKVNILGAWNSFMIIQPNRVMRYVAINNAHHMEGIFLPRYLKELHYDLFSIK